MFTYLPLVLVNVDGSPVEKMAVLSKPIIIFKGAGSVFKHEKHLYHPDVSVFFQSSGIVDEDLMSLIYAEWDRFLGCVSCMLLGDAAKPHWTTKAKSKVSDKTIFARLKESTTSARQYLDTEFNCLFKENYANIFTTNAEPRLKGKGLSAMDKRVL